MNSTTNAPAPKYNRLKIAGIILTLGGIALFGYFIYAVGFREIIASIGRFGFVGFAVILAIYFIRICARAYAWKLCIQSPDKLSLADTVPAVIIGEAMSSMVPLGILISGTTKAVAVKRRVSLVIGLSSVATENSFYSLITGIIPDDRGYPSASNYHHRRKPGSHAQRDDRYTCCTYCARLVDGYPTVALYELALQLGIFDRTSPGNS
ncbi:MAG: flippase-like domain-containing protein [Acidobacteria bacterium]|nr:flippase-like domain-containing protein [Acidobacteriota bacterium]